MRKSFHQSRTINLFMAALRRSLGITRRQCDDQLSAKDIRLPDKTDYEIFKNVPQKPEKEPKSFKL